ncbi:hypothetical protein BDA96_02G400900 [Sorghum bicolor]|uniref:Uncharacterized protein n=1 Tax=Sorghum bicolor TaxID=4558 RepID=A0A921RUE6_SORBI|nr:hypothetical protein BDA96_02G400900 [Sorghum bicolor]
MEHAEEERRTNLPSNTKVKETFSPMLVLMMLMYPTLLGFVLLARLATFALIIPTPTVPGGTADAGKLHGTNDLWETAGAGAIVRTGFAFISIALLHLFLICYIVRGPSGASFMETHRNGGSWAFTASIAFWLVTTSFLLTYTSMARYGAHGIEWGFAVLISICILLVSVPPLCAPIEKVVVGYPPRAMV